MEQIKLFLEKAKTDKELMAKLDALGTKKADDDIIALAAEHGYLFTKEDIEQMSTQGMLSDGELKHCGSCKLSEEELENISGGEHDRYNPEICSQYTNVHYYCVGFMGWAHCTHYEITMTKDVGYKSQTLYWHRCTRGYFAYEGYRNGNRPEPK